MKYKTPTSEPFDTPITENGGINGEWVSLLYGALAPMLNPNNWDDPIGAQQAETVITHLFKNFL